MKHSPEIVSSYARLTVEKQTKITFLKNEKFLQSYQTYFDLPENRINTVDKIVELRGGDLTPLTKVLIRIILIWSMGHSHTPTEGFHPPGMKPSFGHRNQVQPAPRVAPKLQENRLDRNNPRQGSCRAKQNNHDGTLTKEQRRNFLSPYDVFISEQNVTIRHGQAKYKVKKHGHQFGIESTQNSKGQFKIEKTPENVQAFKDEIKHLVLTGERIECTYRIAEPGGYTATHFYDPETRKNAVFKKQTNEFVSAWQLTKPQAKDLVETGNIEDY